MNLTKAQLNNQNGAGVNKVDLTGPRFQNKNLNSFRGGLLPARGPPKPGVQVIQAKQKLGKAVGAAALPPTPLNTPSLKRETETNQSSHRSGQGSTVLEDGSPSLKGLSGPAKPAPWAKPGAVTEVEKAEEQPKPEHLPSSKQNARSWANADDSDEEDRQDNLPETDWPDNFREPIDDLPPAVEMGRTEEDFSQQRYVPPSVRNKPFNGGPDSKFRNDHDKFYDNRYMSQSGGAGPVSNRFQQFRSHPDREGIRDRDFAGHRNDEESRQYNRTHRMEEAEEDRPYDQRTRYKPNHREDGHQGFADNRLSSRFNQDYSQDRGHRGGNDRYDKGAEGRPPYHPTNTPHHHQSYDSRGGDNRFLSRSYDSSGGDPRHGGNPRYPNREDGYDSQYAQNKRGQGNGYYQTAVPPHDEGDGGFRQRSRTTSEDRQHKSSQPARGGRGSSESTAPDDSVDLKGIETSRLEAEYLESRKTKAPEGRNYDSRSGPAYHNQYNQYGQPPENQDRRRQHLQHNVGDPMTVNNHYHNHSNQNYQFSDMGRQIMMEDPNSVWNRNNRAAGPFSSSLHSGLNSKFDNERPGGNESNNLAGAYRGPDAVKISFPQQPQDVRYASNDSLSPTSEAQASHHNKPGGSSDWREEGGRDVHHAYQYQQYQIQNPHQQGYNDVAHNRANSMPPTHNQHQSHHYQSRTDDNIDNNFRSRPKQLFDPKSDQLIDAAGETQRTRQKYQNREEHSHSHNINPPNVNNGRGPKDGGDTERWPKILQHEKKDIQVLESHGASQTKHEASGRSDPVNDKARIAEERKAARDKERMNREPRTKGFLYRYNELGELERVMSKWEKEQELLTEKNSAKESNESEHAPAVLKKPENETTEIQPQSVEGSFPSSTTENLPTPSLETNSTILGTLMQGSSSLFDSWNRGAPPGIEDNRNNNDLSSQSRMQWLTGANSGASATDFTSGLTSLGSELAGIISSSNVTTSLFPESQQNWPYNSILNNEESNHPLNQVFASNSLNDIDREAGSFSPFSGINITNLQGEGVLSTSSDNKESSSYIISPPLHHRSDETAVADNTKFIQKEWQRFANANTFGPVGNKSATKGTAPVTSCDVASSVDNNEVVSHADEATNERVEDTKVVATTKSEEKIETGETSNESNHEAAAKSSLTTSTTSRGRITTNGRGSSSGRGSRAEGRGEMQGGRDTTGRGIRPAATRPLYKPSVVTTAFHTRITKRNEAEPSKDNPSSEIIKMIDPGEVQLGVVSTIPHNDRSDPARTRRSATLSTSTASHRANSSRTSNSASYSSNRSSSYQLNRSGRAVPGPRAQSEVKSEKSPATDGGEATKNTVEEVNV